MFGKKSTKTEHPDQGLRDAVWAMGKCIEELTRQVVLLGKAVRENPKKEPSQVDQWLPVLDRMQELTLVAMGQPDLAQSFGLTNRQKAESEPETHWEVPRDPEEGMTYG